MSWVAGTPPDEAQVSAKTRYRQADVTCTQQTQSDRFSLSFSTPQWAVTPGQSAVLYDGDVCLGGGIIDTAGIV
jgi:tRNA-specific 2-thiouridylase